MSLTFGWLMRSYRAVMATAASIVQLGVARASGFYFVRPSGAKRKRGGSTSWKWRQSRRQEMARRVRQIERGQLTASNGLISERTADIKVNSHGKIHTFCNPCARHFEGQDCDFPNCADVRANGCAA